ncbi:hypothetical protein [Vulcaniibacterium thermophilum]|nr:hypothetical protein [Vulcaniibacterium thermophilum]
MHIDKIGKHQNWRVMPARTKPLGAFAHIGDTTLSVYNADPKT